MAHGAESRKPLFLVVCLLLSLLNTSQAVSCDDEPHVCDHFHETYPRHTVVQDLAYCDDAAGAIVCSCPVGVYGDGYNCSTDAWTVRTALSATGDVVSGWNSNADAIKLMYSNYMLAGTNQASAESQAMALTAHISAEYDADTDLTTATLNALFSPDEPGQIAAGEARARLAGADFLSAVNTELGSSFETAEESTVYRWVTGTTSDELTIAASGFEVEFVVFDPTCGTTGCWVIDIVYTTGAEDAVNVIYLPRNEVDETMYEGTYLPANFPCGTLDWKSDVTNKKTS
eukprot:3875730-Rhodomonas_salina.1